MSASESRWKDAQKHELENFLSGSSKSPEGIDEKEFAWLTDDLTLEIGCRPLDSIHNLSNIVAVDPLALGWAKWYDRKTEHIAAMGERLPFRDGAFSQVVSFNVLDHMMDPALALREMWRVLNDDGVLILWLNVFASPKSMRRILDPIDVCHPHHMSQSEVECLLTQSGLWVVKHSQKRSHASSLKGKAVWFLFRQCYVGFLCKKERA